MRQTIRVVLALALCAFAADLWWPPTAKATPPEASEADKAAAKTLFVKGRQYYVRGQFQEAIRRFQKAYELWKNRNILFNIAICHAERGDRIQAMTFLRASLKGASAGDQAKLKASMPAKLRAVSSRVAVLVVETAHPQAVILVDNAPAGRGTAEKALYAGQYRVEVTVSGRVVAKKTVRLRRGQVYVWKPPVEPPAPETPRPPEKPATPEKPRLAAAAVRPARPSPTSPPADATVRRKSRLGRVPIYYFITVAAIAVAAGAAAIPLGLQTNKYHTEYWDSPTRTTRDKGLTFRAATNGMIGVAAAAGATAAVLAIFTDWTGRGRKKEAESGILLLPGAGPGSGWVTVTGGF